MVFRVLFLLVFTIFGLSGSSYETPCSPKDMTLMKIATGSKSGTYIKIGRDLARFVAPDACINLKPMVTKGSVQNLYELLSTKYVALAIVQSDVLGQFREIARGGSRKAKKILQRLRLVKPLYMEEVHFITQSDSFLKNIQDIEKAKINVGPIGSGTAMSSHLIYQELFGHKIPRENIYHYNYNEALKRLLRGELDVVVMVGGQPLAKLSNMPERAKNSIKLLSYDDDSKNQVVSYEITTLKKRNYPWLEEDINTIGVPSYLVTFNYGRNPNRYQMKMRKALARFAYNLHKNMPILKARGHRKWREVDDELKTPLRGWRYYEVTDFAYRFDPSNCSRRARALTLCR